MCKNKRYGTAGILMSPTTNLILKILLWGIVFLLVLNVAGTIVGFLLHAPAL